MRAIYSCWHSLKDVSPIFVLWCWSKQVSEMSPSYMNFIHVPNLTLTLFLRWMSSAFWAYRIHWLFQRLIGMPETQRLFLIGYLNIHTAISLLLLPCYVGHRGIFEASGLLGFPQNTRPDSFLLLDSTNHGHYSQLRWKRVRAKVFFTETPPIFKLYAIFSFPPFSSLWGLHLILSFFHQIFCL